MPAQFSISIIQPKLTTFGFKEFWGDNENNRSTNSLKLRPSLISFKFKLKGFDIAFLNISKSDFSDAFRTERELITSELRTAQYFDYHFRGKDDWFGLGTNLQIAPKLFLGISQFVRSASFSYGTNTFVEEINLQQGNQSNRLTSLNFEGSYNNLGFVSKGGILLDTDQHDLGLTLTTPTYLRLTRTGDLFFTQTRLTDGTLRVNQVIETEITPVIRSPWEWNLGYSLQLTPKQKIWSTASYHQPIADYNMATATTFDHTIQWRNGSKAVYNVSLGYSYTINPSLQLSGAIRTNNFAYENKAPGPDRVRNIILDGNHIHGVIGSKIAFNRSSILLGIDYGTIRNIPDAEDLQRLASLNGISPSLSGLTKNSLSILFTYGFVVDGIKQLSRNQKE